MFSHALQKLFFLLCLAASGAAYGDLVTSLGSVTAPASVAFSNSAVSVGTIVSVDSTPVYNFLDQISFTLSGNATVSSLTSSFTFNGSGTTFGIADLQVNLVDPTSHVVSPGWQSINANNPFTSLLSTTGPSFLVAGNYTLQVRGLVTNPGSYAGTLIAAAPSAAPLPAVVPSMTAKMPLWISFWIASRSTSVSWIQLCV